MVIGDEQSKSDPQMSSDPDGTVYLAYSIRYWKPGDRSYLGETNTQRPWPKVSRCLAIRLTRYMDNRLSWENAKVILKFYEF